MNRPLLLLVPFLLTACGSKDPAALYDKGSRALAEGDYTQAAEDFGTALEAIGSDASHPAYLKNKLGYVEAQAHIDAAKARDGFLELAGAMPDKITDRDYNRIAGKLGEAGHLTEAVAVLDAGMKAYPESKHLEALLQDLGDRAKKAGAGDALESLKGLGYVGE